MVDGAVPIHWRKMEERYQLMGSKCDKCNSYFFPQRTICPNCRTKGKIESVPMPRTGKIVSYSEVFVGPQGFENETPYFLALIEFDNKARVLAQIVDSKKESVKTGAKVKKVFRKIMDEHAEGIIAYGYKFKVAE